MSAPCADIEHRCPGADLTRSSANQARVKQMSVSAQQCVKHSDTQADTFVSEKVVVTYRSLAWAAEGRCDALGHGHVGHEPPVTPYLHLVLCWQLLLQQRDLSLPLFSYYCWFQAHDGMRRASLVIHLTDSKQK